MANRQYRRRPSIAGGLIVVTVGIIFLIANLQPDLDFWSIAMRYWPVILIVIGLGKIFDAFRIRNDGATDADGQPRGNNDLGIILAMLVLLAFVVVAVTHGHGRVVILRDLQSIDLQSAKTVTANIDMPSGTLDLAGGASKLLDANFAYRDRDGKPQTNYTVSKDEGILDITQENLSHVHLAGSGNDWRLRFSGGVPIDFNLNLGAGKGNVNLQGLDVAHADLKVGVGRLDLDLTGPRKSDLHVDIHGGVGTADIRLPKDVGVRVHASGGIGDVSQHGLTREGDDYVNDALGKTPATIDLTIEGGI